MLTSDILFGIQSGSWIIWLMVIFRYSFRQTPIEARNIEVNVKADRLWRFQNTIMAFSIVLFLAPKDILTLGGLISFEISYILTAIGATMGCLCGILLLHMKDLLEGKSHQAIFVYTFMPLIMVFYKVLM